MVIILPQFTTAIMKRLSITTWHFSRPQLAEHYLRAFDIGLISATAIYAKRRMGKTEFLTQDLTPVAEQHGYAVGYCNLWQEDQEPREALLEAITSIAAPRRMAAKLRAKLALPVSKIKLSGRAEHLAAGEAEVEFRTRDKAAPTHLRQAFDVFDASRNRGLLLIDEAQMLTDLRYEPLRLVPVWIRVRRWHSLHGNRRNCAERV